MNTLNNQQIIELVKCIDTLKTGDLLLCDNLEQKGLGLFGWLIKYGSQSDFSHIGMVVVNPDFTYLDKPLKAVSSYKSDELKDICKRLHIDAHDMTKPQMYEKILSKL